MIKKVLSTLFSILGYRITKIQPIEAEYGEDFLDIYNSCKEYTMTSINSMFALYKSVEYIIKNKIEGDFIECGVWRGGSSMVIAKTLLKLNVSDRKIYLYDTFEGMTAPTENDLDTTGQSAEDLLKNSSKNDGKAKESIWCIASFEEVTQNLSMMNYPSNNIHLIKGKVEDTLQNDNLIEKIALLRLDTDWYESTKIEMEVLFPKLMTKGVLIIDDYGYWLGAKKAIDEYFEKFNLYYLLNKIDFTGRLLIKA